MSEFTLNGQSRPLPDAPLSITALIEAEGFAGRRIAVEQNGEIVPKSRHAETFIAEGDTLEIVVAVGGG
ncbi:MAG: sulfur carrier protein ThiS [Zoogloeaceae bacterium]|jgi:sulfur carrier protein|nr:sulfur carrier protein ThiS [Zoogloeaceae bacterium]